MFTPNDGNRIFGADSGSQTVLEYSRAYWTATLSYGSSLSLQEERALTSMLGKLRGRFGTIKVPCWTRFRDDDVGSITTLVANKDSFTMTVSAPSVLSQKIFSAGDYIAFAGELIEVLDDVVTNADGVGSVTMHRRLRATYSSGTAIEYKEPYCVMRLTDVYSLNRENIVSGTSLSLMEAF
ncbi:MAG: hypothetical protein AB7F25_07085 [Deferribacterales bacterium]